MHAHAAYGNYPRSLHNYWMTATAGRHHTSHLKSSEAAWSAAAAAAGGADYHQHVAAALQQHSADYYHHYSGKRMIEINCRWELKLLWEGRVSVMTFRAKVFFFNLIWNKLQLLKSQPLKSS